MTVTKMLGGSSPRCHTSPAEHWFPPLPGASQSGITESIVSLKSVLPCVSFSLKISQMSPSYKGAFRMQFLFFTSFSTESHYVDRRWLCLLLLSACRVSILSSFISRLHGKWKNKTKHLTSFLFISVFCCNTWRQTKWESVFWVFHFPMLNLLNQV